MIESKNNTSRNWEKALRALEQAKQRVVNEKKKKSEKKRKAEKLLPTIHCPQCRKWKRGRYGMTKAETLESRGNVFTPFTECAQIYHQRWYICAPFGDSFGGHCLSCDSQQGKLPFPTIGVMNLRRKSWGSMCRGILLIKECVLIGQSMTARTTKDSAISISMFYSQCAPHWKRRMGSKGQKGLCPWGKRGACSSHWQKGWTAKSRQAE